MFQSHSWYGKQCGFILEVLKLTGPPESFSYLFILSYIALSDVAILNLPDVLPTEKLPDAISWYIFGWVTSNFFWEHGQYIKCFEQLWWS